MIEVEMLAIVWAVNKCSSYLQGMLMFEFATDHRPLVPILNRHRTVNTYSSSVTNSSPYWRSLGVQARIQGGGRWVQRPPLDGGNRAEGAGSFASRAERKDTGVVVQHHSSIIWQ